MLRQSVASGLTLLLLAALPAVVGADSSQIVVYKSPTCGCCGKWVDHLRQNGLSVKTIDVPDVSPIKRDNKLPVQLSSCHTALVDGYVIEGHVPAQDVKRLLKERPAVSGLAVPRMPIGSPGMEGPNPEPYSVLSFDRSGKIEVFSSYTPDQ